MYFRRAAWAGRMGIGVVFVEDFNYWTVKARLDIEREIIIRVIIDLSRAELVDDSGREVDVDHSVVVIDIRDINVIIVHDDRISCIRAGSRWQPATDACPGGLDFLGGGDWF